MIEVKYYYIKKSTNTPMVAYAVFHNADKALRFMYKCKTSKTLIYSGEFTCDDPYDTEYINRKFR